MMDVVIAPKVKSPNKAQTIKRFISVELSV